MKTRGRKALKKEEIAEDWCFQCKDGGTLLICDYKQCLKVYHRACVDKDDVKVLSSGSSWTCKRHICWDCPEESEFLCYCCPRAYCEFCLENANFVHVKGKYGLCLQCLKLALLVAENKVIDSDGETLDLRNRKTYDVLFREYFEIIQEKEGLNLEVLRAAKKQMDIGRICPRCDNFHSKYSDFDEEISLSELESKNYSEEENQHYEKKGTKSKQSSYQRKENSSKVGRYSGYLSSSDKEEGYLPWAIKSRFPVQIIFGEKKSPKEESVSSNALQSEFAAIVPKNIKLVYLKRDVVYELCKEPAILGDKVAGSFVRVKSYTCTVCKDCRLMQVTGIKKASNCEESATVNLLLSEMPKEICLSMLSNDDFTEAECEDLRSRVQDGVVKRPTVGELEEKAQTLHKDITNHWITNELKLLQVYVDRANERGSKERFEYMERLRLLKTPTEQKRLLGIIPRVIPDVVKPVSEDIGDEMKDKGGSLKSTLSSAPNGNCKGKQNSSAAKTDIIELSSDEEGDDENIMTASLEEQSEQFYTPTPTVAAPTPTPIVVAKTDIIELSSDEEDLILDKRKLEDAADNKASGLKSGGCRVWHISGTDEEKKETYSLSLLKKWSEICTYPAKVKVWKENQSEDSAIWLTDAIKLAFP